MYEPRGHDMMSGSFYFDPHDEENDVAILFIETSGCLPMCGHGLIGAVTILLEEQLVKPKTKGRLRVETLQDWSSFSIHKRKIKSKQCALPISLPIWPMNHLILNTPVLGKLTIDISYGGNFYAIVDPQENFKGMEHYSADQLIGWSRSLRRLVNEQFTVQHLTDQHIKGCSHVMWTGATLSSEATARNAVFYGDKAIDRSPCGTGTSARMAQWYAQGKLK